jgi:hypothetical protein
LLGAGAVVAFVHQLVHHHTRASRIAGLLVEEGICPVCGYNLVGLERTPGPALLCPECGSAWRRERILRMEAFAPPSPGETPGTGPKTGLASGKDDRGQEIPVLPYTLYPALQTETDVAVRWRLLDARAVILRRGRVRRWLAGASLTALLLLMVWVLASVLDTRAAVFVALLGLLLGGTVGSGSLWRGGRALVVRELRVRQLCPGCGRSLVGLHPRVDGCVVCGFCRAVWRTTPPRVAP